MGDGVNNNNKEKVLLIFQTHFEPIMGGEGSFDKNKNHCLDVQFIFYFIRGKKFKLSRNDRFAQKMITKTNGFFSQNRGMGGGGQSNFV